MTTPIQASLLHSFPSPLGKLWLAASDAGLNGLWFHGQKHLPDLSNAKLWRRGLHPYMQVAMDQLNGYFGASQRPQAFQFGEVLPLDLRRGTVFQQAVWQALLKIAPGASVSYGELATRIGKPQAVRALGAAVGRNPISILIPCHRVLGKDGSLTGYAGGLERKTALLRREGVLP